ncbi:MAG TPA: hypothetical protein VF520_01650 [Thermoleophilaceae bacterium]
MDPVLTAGVGAACAAAGSFVTGYLLKRSEQRRALRDAGRLEVERKRSLDLYEALRGITGHIAELDHCIMHLSSPRTDDGRRHYSETGARVRSELRALARAEIQVLGEDTVQLLMWVTDLAGRFFAAAESPAASDEDLATRRFTYSLERDRAMLMAHGLLLGEARPDEVVRQWNFG